MIEKHDREAIFWLPGRVLYLNHNIPRGWAEELRSLPTLQFQS